MAEAVYWIEAGASAAAGSGSTLAAAPIDVGPILREHLFDKVPTVIMTSATLATAGQVRFLPVPRRADCKPTSLCLGSPFDYQRAGRADPAGRHARPERRAGRATSGRRST